MSKPTLMVLFVTSAIVVASGTTALAKGPESVMITGPGIDAPIELMDAVSWPILCDESCPPDPMVRLMEQTGLWYATGDLPVRIAEPSEDLGPAHILVWVIPTLDSSENRTIRQLLYLYADNGPVIHTPTQEGLEGWGPGVVGWFIAPDGLGETLAALGVPISAQQSTSDLPNSNKTAATSADTEPTDRLRYLAMGLAFIGLVWAARRRMESA